MKLTNETIVPGSLWRWGTRTRTYQCITPDDVLLAAELAFQSVKRLGIHVKQEGTERPEQTTVTVESRGGFKS